jgi:hypothetical protein
MNNLIETGRALQDVFAYLGGRTDAPPRLFQASLSSPFWGLWWGILLVIALIFCGQSSKFIYIDF